MIAYAYINLKKTDYDKFVYKIIPLRRFQNILLSKTIGFVNPSLWDDPYENFLLNQTFKIEDGEEKSFKDLTNSLYGSCWTFNHNTDYGWKVYLKDEIGVQIKTKVSRLYSHFSYLKKDTNVATFQIGKVSYMKWKALKDTYEKSQFNAFMFLMNQSSFIKRYEYVHEKEVRILLRYDNHPNNILTLDFDVNEISKTIMLDPRLSYSDYELERQKLLTLGYKGRIYRSTLYTPPKLNLDYKNIKGSSR
jgi:hypothetical protein